MATAIAASWCIFQNSLACLRKAVPMPRFLLSGLAGGTPWPRWLPCLYRHDELNFPSRRWKLLRPKVSVKGWACGKGGRGRGQGQGNTGDGCGGRGAVFGRLAHKSRRSGDLNPKLQSWIIQRVWRCVYVRASACVFREGWVVLVLEWQYLCVN